MRFYKTSIKFNYFFLIIGFFLFFLHPLIGSLRLRQSLKIYELFENYKNCFLSTIISFAFNVILPAKAGDFSKALFLKSIQNKSIVISAVLNERVSDIMVLLLMFLIASIFLSDYSYINVLILLFIVVFILIILSNLLKNINFKSNILKKINIFYIETFNVWKNINLNNIQLIFYSSLMWLLGITQIWLYFLAFDYSLNILLLIKFFPLIIISTLLPITPSGVGVRELSFIFFLKDLAPPELLILISLLYFFSSTLINGIIGFFFYLNYKN